MPDAVFPGVRRRCSPKQKQYTGGEKKFFSFLRSRQMTRFSLVQAYILLLILHQNTSTENGSDHLSSQIDQI